MQKGRGMKDSEVPWAHLDEFRGVGEGKIFNSQWPTLPQMLEVSAALYGKYPCFTDFDNAAKRTMTYNEVLSRVREVSAWMADKRVCHGDRVAVTGKNSPEWAIVYLATLYLGAIIVPLDHGLHIEEVKNLIRVARPVMLFSDEDKFDELEKMHALSGFALYSISANKGDVFIGNIKMGGKALLKSEAAAEDLAAILFTSGTTGEPKGVMLTHENLVSDCFIAQMNFHHGYPDVFYALLPIHHAYTMQAALINPLSQGDEIVFGKSMAVTKLMQELRDGGITVMLGVPLLYNKLLAGIKKGIREKGIAVAAIMNILMSFSYIVRKVTGHNIGKVIFKGLLKKANISTLRVAICGGGPLSPKVFKAYNALGIDFIQGYGLTETSPIIALNPLEHFKIQSVGKDFYPHEEIKILEPDEHGIGEIAVKGPMVMKGYYNMADETAKMFTKDGFLKTGDVGYMDREHYIMLCGRAKNIIVTSGGKNVFPEEIEDAFQLCTDIQQVTVTGYVLDSDMMSEEVEALIYPSDDVYTRLNVDREQSFDSSAVREVIQRHVDAVNKDLQPYARITRVTILKAPLEMTTTMKVRRL